MKKFLHSTINIVKLQVFLTVVFSYLLEIPRYFETKMEEVTCSGYTYVIWSSTQLMENHVFKILYRSILTSLLINYLPLFLTALMSYFLIKYLIAKRKIRTQFLAKRAFESKMEKHDPDENITTVLTVIALTYIFCMAPVALYPIFRLFLGTSYCGSFLFYFSTAADFVHIVNSAFNFFIYYLNIPMFRTCLKKMLENYGFCKSEKKTKVHSLKIGVAAVSPEIVKSS